MLLLIELSFCACIAVKKQLRRRVKMIFFMLDFMVLLMDFRVCVGLGDFFGFGFNLSILFKLNCF